MRKILYFKIIFLILLATVAGCAQVEKSNYDKPKTTVPVNTSVEQKNINPTVDPPRTSKIIQAESSDDDKENSFKPIKLSIDINNDGVLDNISFKCKQEAQYKNEENGDSVFFNATYLLEVNDTTLSLEVDDEPYSCSLVDIDNNDNFKEIAISVPGPSSEDFTYFYYYDKNKIEFIGSLLGTLQDIIINGNNVVIEKCGRGKILHTWVHDKHYSIWDNHKFYQIELPSYQMGSIVTLKHEFILREEKFSDKLDIKLSPGTQITIVSSDDIEWCEVEAPNGKHGWFSVQKDISDKGLTPRDIFDGLNFAD